MKTGKIVIDFINDETMSYSFSKCWNRYTDVKYNKMRHDYEITIGKIYLN